MANELKGVLTPGPQKKFDAGALPTPEEQAQAETLDLTQGFTLSRSPEASADALDVMKEHGVTFEQAEKMVKERDPGLVGTLRAMPSWSSLVKESPVLAERLTDPARASALQGDVENLKGIERLFSTGKSGWWENLKKSGKRGMITQKLGDLGWKELTLTATPEDLAEADKLEAEMEQYPDEELGLITGIPGAALESGPIMVAGMLRSVPYAGAGALAGAGVGAAGGAVAGGVGAGPGAIAGARFGAGAGFRVGTAVETGKSEGGLALREIKKIPGVSADTARKAAFVVGAVNGALETVGIESILAASGAKKLAAKITRQAMTKALKNTTKRALLVEIFKRMGEGALGEGITEYLQEISNIVAEGESAAGTSLLSPEGIGIAWEATKKNQGRAISAGIKGAQGGIGFAGAGSVISLRSDLKAVQAAKDRVAFFDELGKLAKDSTTRERLPEEFREYVDKITEKYGTVDGVTVPADKLIALFQKEEISMDEVRAKMPNVAKALDDATRMKEETGLDVAEEVAIPLPDFATYVAGLEGFESIKEDLRVGDEPTLREAKEVEQRAKDLLKEMKNAEKDVSLLPEESKAVFDDVMKKLTDAGISEETAARPATIWTAFAETRAKRLGVSALEYYKGLNLSVTNADLVEALAPEAKIETLTPEQLNLREKAMAGDEVAFDALVDTLQTDELTGANTQSAWKIFHGKNRPGWYVSIDVNDLKRINDLLGHPKGDEYLKAISGIVGPEARKRKGKFFRGGQGDELILHFVDRAQAEESIKGITAALNALPAMFDIKHKASISLGLGQSFEQADAAQMKAKEQARAKGRSGFGRPGAVTEADLSGGDVFAATDESAPTTLKQPKEAVVEVRKPERDEVGFFSGVEKAALDAKQQKGDAKSWMSILSKSSKKEELAYLGIEEWMQSLGRAITKEEISDYVRAHRISITEKILGEAVGLTQEERDAHEDTLNEHGISVSENGRFTYVKNTEEETTDFDDGFQHAKDSGAVSGRTASALSDLYEEIQGEIAAFEDRDNENADAHLSRAQELAEEWNDRADGTGMHVSVSNDGNLYFRGYIEGEEEIHDPDEIVSEISDSWGRREAAAVEEAFNALGGETAADSTQYDRYTLGRDNVYAEEGTYREFLFYAPGEEAETRKGFRWDAPHFDQEGRGLLAHARIAIHTIDGKKVLMIEEIQSDRFQGARDIVQAAKKQIKKLEKKIQDELAPWRIEQDVREFSQGEGFTDEYRAQLRENITKDREAKAAKWREEIATLKKQIETGGFDTVEAIAARLEVSYNEQAQKAEVRDPLTGKKTTARPNTSINPEDKLIAKSHLIERAAKTFAEEEFSGNEAVRDAPLKTVWEDFVVKRLLLYAAEKGLDRVAWATGEQQIKKYPGLETEVSKISWRKGIITEEGREFESKQQAAAVLGLRYERGEVYDASGKPLEGKTAYFLTVYDRDGAEFHHDALEGPKTLAELRGIIGNELVQKIEDSDQVSDTLVGEDLKLGGEGMRFVYDKRLPGVIEKLLKAKPELVEHTGMRKESNTARLAMRPQEIEERYGHLLQERSDKLGDYIDLAKEMRETGKPIGSIESEIGAYREAIEKIPRYKAIVAENVKDPSHLTDRDRAWAAEQWWIEPSTLEAVGTLDDKFWDIQKSDDTAVINRLQRKVNLAREMAAEPILRKSYGDTSVSAIEKAVPNSIDIELLTGARERIYKFREGLFQFSTDRLTIRAMLGLRSDHADYVVENYAGKFARETGFPEIADIIKFEHTVEPGEQVWAVPIPEATLKKIADEGLSLFQKGAKNTSEDYRGKIEFDDTRRWFKVTLTGAANLSTFLHESGHAFLEILRRDAATDEQSRKDLEVLERWMADGSSTRTEALEKFARGFETYLMEGKAPSAQLTETFQAIKAWLVYIYRVFTKLNAPLTDEVRGVMDRLLASEDEIANARQRMNLFPVSMPDMSKEEAAAFKDRYERAVKAKQAEMESDALQGLRRAMTDAQRGIREEVENEARGRKDFNASEFLRTGKPLNPAITLPAEIQGKKLSKKTINEYIEEGDRRKVKLLKMVADDGIDADAMAPFLGYADGQELVTALLDSPSRAGWIKEEVTRRMKDKYPDTEVGTLAEKAMAKLHDPAIDEVLEAELDAFERKSGATPTPRARDVLRLAARERVQEMTQQEMAPGVHLRAEEQYAKEVLAAVAKKDYLAAREARRKQMYHRFLYREVTQAKEEINRIRDYLKGFENLPIRKIIGKAGERYLNAIDAIVDGVELTKQSDKALARRAALESYLNEMEADGEPVAVAPELRAELGLKNYRQMTLSEMRAVRDAVKNIETLARLKNKLLIGKERREFVKTTVGLAAHVRANVGVNFKDGIGEPTWWEKRKEFLRRARSNMTKIEFICRVLDGGKTAGWAHELLFQPFRDAQARKWEMSKQITEQLIKPFREMSFKDRLRFDRRVDFLGHKLRFREVIALILNLGNEGNKEKTLKGFGWKEQDVLDRLSQMKEQGLLTDKDLDLVEHIWKTINTLWPEIRALSQRSVGLAPEQVQPSPLAIGNRTLAGGYYPIVYNRRLSHKAEQIAQRKTGDLFENNFLLPAVEKGFTESRTKFFAPISLSLDNVPAHINEVIHYVTHYEAVRAVDRITSSKVVREAITEGLGREVYGLFRPWLQAIAADGAVHESTKWYDALFRHLRLGSSIAILGFKVTTGLKQIFGLTSTAKELGFHTITGMGIFTKKLFTGKNPFAEVKENSPEFANIDLSMDRDIAAMFNRLTTGAFSEYGALKQNLAHFAMAWMMLWQKTVNAITWYGAREKALQEGHANPNAYADTVVSMTQSSGGIKDLAAIQRGSETEKMFTIMYTYFSTLFNQISEAMPNKKLPAKMAIMAARWWWLVTLPAMLDAVAANWIPKDDKDREKYLEALTLGQMLYFARSIPVAGDALTAAAQDRQVRYGAWYATLLRGAKAAGNVARHKGDASKGDLKDLNDLLGAAAGLPANAARNAMLYLDKLTDGTMEEPVQNLLFRNPSEWE